MPDMLHAASALNGNKSGTASQYIVCMRYIAIWLHNIQQCMKRDHCPLGVVSKGGISKGVTQAVLDITGALQTPQELSATIQMPRNVSLGMHSMSAALLE